METKIVKRKGGEVKFRARKRDLESRRERSGMVLHWGVHGRRR